MRNVYILCISWYRGRIGCACPNTWATQIHVVPKLKRTHPENQNEWKIGFRKFVYSKKIFGRHRENRWVELVLQNVYWKLGAGEYKGKCMIRVEPSRRELVPLGKRPTEIPHLIHHVRAYSKKTAVCKLEIGSSADRVCRHLDLGGPSIQTCEKQISVYKPLNLCCFIIAANGLRW